jgi:hypothetical protein
LILGVAPARKSCQIHNIDSLMCARLTDFSCAVNTFCPPLREPCFHRMFGFRSPIFDFTAVSTARKKGSPSRAGWKP